MEVEAFTYEIDCGNHAESPFLTTSSILVALFRISCSVAVFVPGRSTARDHGGGGGGGGEPVRAGSVVPFKGYG